jgi:uncharacterized membrane protein YeiH
MMELITTLDLIGTFAFAMSGALAASEKKLDLFGMLVISFVTALGGGTLRDILLGQQPVGWMLHIEYLPIVLAGAGTAHLFRTLVYKLRKTLFFFDAVGLAVFTILGLEKTQALGLPAHIAVIMGVISAVFGGVMRDILCNEIPLIFRKEIYATACVAGGALYLGLHPFLDATPLLLSTISFILLLRIIAVRFHWHLPVLSKSID